MIKADIHTHSSNSGDSTEPMERMILAAIDKGIDTLCITEHMDMDYPIIEEMPDGMFLLDTDTYYEEYLSLKDKYPITLLFGVELGLQPHLFKEHSEYVKKYPFDFVIGSEHVAARKDPYFPYFYEGRSEQEAYSEYFDDIVKNLKAFSDIDTLGHLDYVIRYGPNKNTCFSYGKYADYLDEILKILVSKEIGLEVNSSGYKYGLGAPNPCKDIILRYKELGGKIITIGSDAHEVTRIAADFDKVESLLYECGFDKYCIFKNRKPEYISF